MKQIHSLLLAVACAASGCADNLLDAKPDQALVVPKTLADFSALLDHPNVFGTAPGLPNIASDDFMITDAGWIALPNPLERNGYIWGDDIYEGQRTLDWNTPYQQVFYSNVVLEGLSSVDSASSPAEFRRIKGTALFCRGFAFHNLAQLFCGPFLTTEDGSKPGIPIRLAADINSPIRRAAVAETYGQVFSDLAAAADLLPQTALFKTRPTRAAATALLARAYLSCNRYAEALSWADATLQEPPQLLHYATMANPGTRPFPELLPNSNDEALYYAYLRTYQFNSNGARNVYVPEATFELYDDDDLRKTHFFSVAPSGSRWFSGSYISTSRLFSGPSMGETYLVKAECLARLGRIAESVAALNTLLEHRYAKNAFIPYRADEIPDALGLVLRERRKELIGRGLRWSDLRRLNAEPGRETVITRNLNGKTYRLEPGSIRYVFPLPDEEVILGKLEQNPR